MDPDLRRCVPLEIPAGPAGLDVLVPALAGAIEGTGPAIGLVPGAAPEAYRAAIRAAVQPGRPVRAEVAVVVATSGSTGDPAGVLLPATALCAAAQGFAERRGVPRHRWVAALPLHHAGGLMVAVRAHAAGTAPMPVESLGGAAPFTVAGFARATRAAVALSQDDGLPLAVSLVPAMLAALDASGDEGRELLAAYDTVLVGGAAAPRPLVDRLRSAGVSLVTSYGMTETCGGAVLDGRPLAGVTVSAEPDGRLRICGPQVAAGYRDGRAADRWGAGPDGIRCFRTDDLGRVGPDGRVAVAGRADDVVQVGGASVSLGAVAGTLRADWRVAAAEAVALPDDRLGSVVVAFVVPVRGGGAGPVPPAPLPPAPLPPAPDEAATSPADQLAGQLADEVAAALGRPARPRVIRLVAELPMLESGKADRQALLRIARALVDPQTAPGGR
jgi:O-succinylbenzoic acid--CoA ligase